MTKDIFGLFEISKPKKPAKKPKCRYCGHRTILFSMSTLNCTNKKCKRYYARTCEKCGRRLFRPTGYHCNKPKCENYKRSHCSSCGYFTVKGICKMCKHKSQYIV